mgnify:FL=1
MFVINWEFAIEQFPEVLKGVPVTLAIAVVAMLLGMFFGILIALIRIYKVPVLNRLFIIYISFIRGTPLIVQLYVFFYGFPVFINFINTKFGTNFNASEISPLVYAFIAFTINTSAYQAEIFRSSINAIHVGQMEAAQSIGMTTTQALWRIILPQAFIVALPNLGNTFIGIIKGTSLAFAVKVVEVMALARIIANDGYMFLEMYLVAALIYWIISLGFEYLFVAVEKRMRRFETNVDPKVA